MNDEAHMIVGLMAVAGKFPMWPIVLENVAQHCDLVNVWLDVHGDDRRGYLAGEYKPVQDSAIREVLGEKCGKILHSEEPWNTSNWQESLLRSADDIRPDWIVKVDDDEVMDHRFAEDFQRFQKSGRDMYMVETAQPMPTIDGALDHYPRRYPSARHCKAFRWQEGLSFLPYRGYCRPTQYAAEMDEHKKKQYNAKSKMRHLCFFTPQMREDRKLCLEKYITCQQPRRLELGSGPVQKDGWHTLDGLPGATYTAVVPPLPPEVAASKWDVVQAIHFLEHLDRADAQELLTQCFGVLAPRGKLIIELPNILYCAEQIVAGSKDARHTIQPMYGDVDPSNPLSHHRWSYTPTTLAAALKTAGFCAENIIFERPRYHVPKRDMRAVALKNSA